MFKFLRHSVFSVFVCAVVHLFVRTYVRSCVRLCVCLFVCVFDCFVGCLCACLVVCVIVCVCLWFVRPTVRLFVRSSLVVYVSARSHNLVGR